MIKYTKQKHIIGFSATPIRDTCKKVSIEHITNIFSNDSISKKLCLYSNYSMIDAIKDDIILPPSIHYVEYKSIMKIGSNDEIKDYSIDNYTVIKKILDGLIPILPYKKIIFWCRNTKTLKRWIEKFKEDHSYDAFSFYKTTYKDNTKCTDLDNFYNSERNSMLFCINKCQEGSDINHVDCGINLDAVKKRSFVKTMQSGGRIMRPDKEKKKERAHIIEPVVIDLDSSANMLTIQKVLDYYKDVLDLNDDKDWESDYENLLELVKNSEIDVIQKKIIIKIDGNERHNIVMKFEFIKNTSDWGNIKNMLKTEITKNSSADLMEQLSKEYMLDKKQNIDLCIGSSEQYAKMIDKYNFKNNPKEYYKSIWINWGNYLGLDQCGYPVTMKQWRALIKNRNIRSFDKYMDCVDLPSVPSDLYDEFTNIDNELKKIWAVRRVMRN